MSCYVATLPGCPALRTPLMTYLSLSYALLAAVPLLCHVYTLPVYAHMILMTLITIFIGAHLSLPNADESIPTPELESMSRKDAWMFPVIGSCVLVGLYLVFKYLPEYYVNLAVKCYFFAVGSIALTVTLATAAQHILPSSLYKSLVARSWSIRVPRVLKELLTDAPSQGDKQFWVSVQLTLLDLCCGVLSLACGAAYLNTNLWSLSNLFGVAFCLQGLSLISLGSTINGLIMLWGLFIYDITWVFGSDVMVTVAKKFDAPIKLLFPRDAIRPAMLGLGDIVIPGIFMAMMLRLDRHIAEKQAPNSTRSQSFAKPYFYSVMVGYWIGLSITLGIMYWFEHAQPALLYLVPTCNLSVLICAAVRGEVSLWFNFDESPAEKSDDKKTDDKPSEMPAVAESKPVETVDAAEDNRPMTRSRKSTDAKKAK